MRISKIQTPITFKRALKQEELADYKKVLADARKTVGQTGKSIFIMPTSCLPQTSELNTGIGHIASPKAQEYFDYMHNYLGFNVVEDLPAGQVENTSGMYCAYNGSALGLGNHQISPELLTTPEYENLLTKEEVKEIVKSNTSQEKDTIVNFKNVMDADGAQNAALKKAYERFKNLDDSSELKKRYTDYARENDDWLSFERENEPDVDFYKFKQFLADEHLKKGKEELNKKGVKLAGDCLIGFSKDEVKAFPKAFKKDHFIGMPDWGLPSLDYDTILDKDSDAYKLLKRKIQLYAKRYDIIRFDVAWAYVTPVITPSDETEVLEENRKYMQDSLLKNIEEWVKEVKGEDFDLKNLIYEFDADGKDFEAFNNDNTLIAPLQGRVKIYGNTYMHNTPSDKWGYNKAFLDRGWSPDEYILGVGNHDPQPLRQIAEGTPEKKLDYNKEKKGYDISYESHKPEAIKPLSEELSLDKEKLEDPVEFAKAKFAEPMMSKNNQYFYMDVFGRSERFDMQKENETVHPEKNYAYKVPEDFQKAYHSSLEEGFGFNAMDSMKKVFEAKGYDKTEPELYEKIKKYNNILCEKTTETKPPKKKTLKIVFGALGGLVVAIGGLFAHKKHKEKSSKANKA